MVMTMRVEIDKHKITNNDLIYLTKPSKVYIPLISGNDTDITVLVNKGEYVYKGTMIAKRKGDFRIPIHSSVSGTVLDFEEKTCFNGSKVKCVVIKNDFKELLNQPQNIKKNITDYTKQEFINVLRDNGIIGLGGAGFPTYVKYDNDNIKTLIVNAVECEPYITADEMLSKTKCEEILEAIDAIIDINNIEQAIIAIKETNVELRKIFDNYIGTYLKIKIKCVKNYYPAGWEKNLVEDVIGKSYDRLPLELGVVVNNISTIYAIYEALKYNKPLIERIITFSGDALKTPSNVLVKIGTPVEEILNQLGRKQNSVIISGGPMMGIKVIDDLVISSNQNSILSLSEIKSCPSNCLRCGKCVEVCPAKLTPVSIMNKVNSKKCNFDSLTEMQPLKCIECGLCSYICPAKILVREEVKKAKKVIKEGK